MGCTTIMTTLGLLVYAVVLLLSPSSKGETRFDHKGDLYWTNYSFLNIKEPEFINIIEYAIKEVDILNRLETNLGDNNIRVKNGTLAYGQFLDYMPSLKNRDGVRDVEILLKMAQHIKAKHCSRYGFSHLTCAEQLSHLKIPKQPYGEKCAMIFYNQAYSEYCELNNYRSPNGYCNNLIFKARGQENTAYKRLMFAEYGDGINSMKNLPSARELSHDFVTRKCSLNTEKTMTIAIWAAFIGHDMSHTAVSTMANTKDSMVCCDDEGTKHIPRYTHPSCAPIPIPRNDTIYSVPQWTCMNYVRSMPAMRVDCTLGPREQVNQATHFLDGSVLYGSNAERMRALRDPSSGRGQLLVHHIDRQLHYLPELVRGPCAPADAACARTGGDGANVHPMLTALHTAWMREHNRVAKELSYINVHWRDQKLFDEARKIVSAVMQHITYNEWLPGLIGDEHLLTGTLDLYRNTARPYDWKVDPGVSQAFAVGVLQPLVHSMMTDVIKFYHDNGTEKGCMSLRTFYSKSRAAQLSYTDPILRGMTLQNVQNVGMSFTKYITNFLYSSNTLGMDQLALDIQRGRDHGIPSYPRFREFCGLPTINNWKNVGHALNDIDIMRQLKTFYSKWEDIDLVVGALLEKHLPNSLIGPTMACIIKEQLIRTKLGDRHFYDRPEMFTPDQLAEIKRMTLTRVLCDNSHEFPRIQFSVFDKPKSESQFYPCYVTSLTPKMSLKPWMEIDPTSNKPQL